MLPIDTSVEDDEEIDHAPNDTMVLSAKKNAIKLPTISKIQLKSPKYGIHSTQFPNNDKHVQKRPSPSVSRTRTISTTSTSVNSHEHSAHTRSGHSRSSRNTQPSSASNDNSNKIIVSPFSSLATQSIGHGKYQQALEYYQLALQDYTKDSSKTTIVELVNAAATCFNLGALAKKLREYSKAAEYFIQAQEIYVESRTAVEKYVRSRGTTGPVSPSASSVSSASLPKYSCQVCLLQLIVETLQARAHLHYKYQSQIDDAVECHEKVIELLEDSSDRSSRTLPIEHDIVYHKIHFTILFQHSRWQFLATSLQALGKFYMEKGELEEAIVSYQDTLSILRKIDEFDIESTVQRQEEILQILRALCDFYMRNHLESTDVMKLERAAFLQEDLENWEKAMQCWERVLYCQSKKHGEESLEVSITLGQLARVMVLEGNLEGALDLYHATANIFLRNSQSFERRGGTSLNHDVVFSIPEEIFSGILDIYNELDRIPDGITWLKGLLSKSERREDQARIQLELGKLYLHQGFIHSASDSLHLSLELFDGEDESAFELLKKVEYLGKNNKDEVGNDNADVNQSGIPNAGDSNDDRHRGIDCLTAITEAGESDFLTEGTSAATSSLGAALSGGDTLLDGDDDESEDLSLLLADTNYDDPDDNDDGILEMAIIHDISPKNASYQSDECSSKKVLESTGILDHANTENHSTAKSGSINDAASCEESFGNEKDPDAKDELYSKGINVLELDCSDHDRNENNEYRADIQKNDILTEFANHSTDEAEAHKQNHMFELEESPMRINNDGDGDGYDDTPTTMTSTNSRTALIKPGSNHTNDEPSLNLPNISSTPKASPTHKISIGRKVHTDTNTSSKQPGYTGRSRIVKALASPFRRSRSKSRSTATNPLVPLDEEKEVRQSMPVDKVQKDIPDAESFHSREAPISYIDLRNLSDDDRSLVSQLTFKEYELLSKKKEKRNENGHWWWGVTSEGLEGWFPSNYVNQAVEAAEGFLSAKAIHDRVKSRPLDFDSEDEEEDSEEADDDFSLLKDSFSKQSKTKESPPPPKVPQNQVQNNPVDISSESRKQSFSSSAAKDLNEMSSESNKPPCIDSQIKGKKNQLEEWKKDNDTEDVHLSMLLFEIAELYIKKKDSANGMLYCRQALRIQKSTLHLSEACKSLGFMAEVHLREKRFKDALSCNSEALRIQESRFGYFHEEVAKMLNHAGHILARQGQFDLAMDKHKEALRILKESCGENVKNPVVSETLIQIGAVYYKERNSLANIQSKQNDGYTTFIEGGMLEVIGRAHEDRGSYRMAIAFFEEKLQFLNDDENSDDLEDVAETLNSLGMLSCRAGMYLEAIDYYDRALGIQMKLGCDDVQLAMARVLTGSVQYYLGHFHKALKLYEEALGTLRQVGLEQETVAATLFHIGMVHSALGNYDGAMSNLHNALDIHKNLLGNEHPATFRTRREIGNLCILWESDVNVACEEFNDIIEGQRRLHGEKHPNVAETLHSIGCAQAKKGNFDTALRSLEDCYNMRLKFLGMDHPQQATTLHEIAKIQLKRGRLKKAIHIIDAALNIRVESLSEHHIDVALAMATKATCLVAKSSFAGANKLFSEALTIAKTAVGNRHPSVAWIHVQIGVMHLRKCDFELASSAVKDAISIYRQSVDGDHPGMKEATEELERIERAEMLCV